MQKHRHRGQWVLQVVRDHAGEAFQLAVAPHQVQSVLIEVAKQLHLVHRIADADGGGSGVGGGINSDVTGMSPALLTNTIVAHNQLGNSTANDVVAAVDPTSHHNLIGVDTGLTGITNGVNGNIIGTAAVPIGPMLGPLQDNGGATLTHAPLPGSPVIDAGDPAFVPPPFTDQRGYYRVVDGNSDMTPTIDIGAVEYASVPPLPGDGNLDQVVDGLDYVVWAMNYGNDPADDPLGTPLNGDFNDDGVVDGLDYILWAAHFGESVATASAAQNASAVDAALESDIEPAGASSADASLPHVLALAADGEVTSAVDAVFEQAVVKKRLRRRGR